MSSRNRTLRIILLGALVFLGLALPQATHAATIVVTNTGDSGPGSFRQAINDAAPGDTINFSVTGTITLTTAALWIDKSLTIDGPGAANLTISRNDAPAGYQPQAFIIFSGNVTINDLTISHASNGAITNYGATVTVSRCVFSNNQGIGLSNASAIFNNATLVVANSTFLGNTNGNSICNTGDGQVTVTNSVFSGNTCPDFSAGIFSRGTLAVINSTFTNNTSGDGGGIHVGDGAKATVTNSTFTNNHATWGGGLTNSSGGVVDLIGNTFSNNTADYGGAIYSGNLYAPGSITNLTNSTVSGNAGNIAGGGIYILDGSANITNSTLSTNGSPSGGAISKPSGASVRLKNTIVANSTLGANCSSSILNGGGNLQYGGTNPTSCHIAIPVGDPKLASLADNGGSTQTLALLPGSAALDAGDNNICLAAPVNNLDQRGSPRPVDGDRNGSAICDAGAYEYGGVVATDFLYLPLVLRQ